MHRIATHIILRTTELNKVFGFGIVGPFALRLLEACFARGSSGLLGF
ncbi:MAG: hypothetical protein MUQ67_10925 [Pirellulales bacterium]|nr:hypothetical protein [Pirellulales bacterium]MDO7689855.1 hypothetical protein [Pirellulales bacterium]